MKRGTSSGEYSQIPGYVCARTYEGSCKERSIRLLYLKGSKDNQCPNRGNFHMSYYFPMCSVLKDFRST